jgi:hypothetical protein
MVLAFSDRTNPEKGRAMRSSLGDWLEMLPY